jgi:hypothetical protein
VKIDTEKILPVEFTLPQLERDNLVQLGYETTKKYLTNDLLQKKKIILPHYAVILDNLIKIKYLNMGFSPPFFLFTKCRRY